MTAKRRWLIALALVAVIAVGTLPLLRAERFRGSIHQALEKALERRVDIAGKVTFGIWNGPGFSISNVTIHEDPAIGIEPFAYVAQLDASIRVLALLSGRLEVERIVLDEPRVNLVKQESGAWNVRRFLAKGAGAATVGSGIGAVRSIPEIRVRAGRINFKFDDTKSVLYLSNADFDVVPQGSDRIGLSFRAEPARTDRPAQGIGTLSGNGNYRWFANQPGRVELDLDLQRSAVSDIVSLLEGRGAGMRGFLASRARIEGPLDTLKIEGSLRLEDIQRWDLLRGNGNWPVRYRGSLDFLAGGFHLDSQAEGTPAPFRLRLRGRNIFEKASWGSILEVRDMPFATLRDVLTYMNVATPENLTLDGKINGVISYSPNAGMQGVIEAPEASVKNEDVAFVLKSARVAVDRGAFRLMPSQLEWAGGQTIEVDGVYSPSGYNLRWRTGTQFIPVRTFLAQTKLAGRDMPFFAGLAEGQWRGVLECFSTPEGALWNGTFALREAKLAVPGLASPVVLQHANGSLRHNAVVLDQITGAAGDVEFQGSVRSNQWRLKFEELDLAALERLFLPTLKRNPGLLRTLTRRAAPVPDWLRERKLVAAIDAESLWAGEVWLGELKGRLAWNGTAVDLTASNWQREEAVAVGKLSLRLSGAEPAYKLAGEVTRLSWKESAIEGDVLAETSGTGLALLRNAKANGAFLAKSLILSPEGEFRTASGNYEISAPRGAPLLKLSAIEASGGAETYTGQGGTESDGRLVVDLTNSRKKLRLAGTVWPFQLEPIVAR